MSISIKVENDYLYLLIVGHISSNELFDLSQHAASVFDEDGVLKALVDVRNVKWNVSNLDMRRIIDSLSDVYPRQLMHAVLFSEATCEPKNARFSERVAWKMGVSLKMFPEPIAAREWLPIN